MLALFGIYVFWTRIFKEIYEFYIEETRLLRELIFRSKNTFDHADQFFQSIADFREKRNEFWNIYGQLSLSIFIVTILAILMLSGTIDPDAGLPILSGVSGFAIAKGVSTARSNREPSRPSDPERPFRGEG